MSTMFSYCCKNTDLIKNEDKQGNGPSTRNTSPSLSIVSFRGPLVRSLVWRFGWLCFDPSAELKFKNRSLPKTQHELWRATVFGSKIQNLKALPKSGNPAPYQNKTKTTSKTNRSKFKKERRHFLSNHHRTRLARKSVQLWNAKIWLRTAPPPRVPPPTIKKARRHMKDFPKK